MIKNKLELLLNKERYDPKKIFSKLKITDYAFKKANAYAQLLTKMTNQPLECYGYLLADKNNNDIIIDIFVPKQKVSGGRCDVISEDKDDFSNFLKKNNYASVGWWHSHGNISTFHSSIDDDNTNTSLAFSTSLKVVDLFEKNFLSGNLKIDSYIENGSRKLKISNEGNNEKNLILELDKDCLLENFKVKNVFFEEPIGFYNYSSMVINNNLDEPHVEIWATKNTTKKRTVVKPNFEIYKSNNANLNYPDITHTLVNNVKSYNGELNFSITKKDIQEIDNRLSKHISNSYIRNYKPPKKTNQNYVDSISDDLPLKTRIVEKPVEKIVEKPIKIVDNKKVNSLQGEIKGLEKSLNSKIEFYESKIKATNDKHEKLKQTIVLYQNENVNLKEKYENKINNLEKRILKYQNEKITREIKKEPKRVEPKKKLTESIDSKISTGSAITKEIKKTATVNRYYNRITNYSTSLENIVLKDVSEILSGDHKQNGKRTWEWKQREKEIKKYYRNNTINYSNNDKKKVEELVDIVESNKYATRNHRRRLNNIYDTIKYKGESKVKRFFKRNWKKFVAGGLVAAIAVGGYFGVKAYNENKVQPFAKNIETKVKYITKEDISQPITIDSVIQIDTKGDNSIKIYESASSETSQINDETYIVKKGDCLWNIAKNYVREQDLRPNNKIVTEITNIIAEDNGKSKLGVYRGLEKKDMKNPNLIYLNDKLLISVKVDNLIKKYKQGDTNA